MIENVIPKRFIPALPGSLTLTLLSQIKAWIPTGETLLFQGATGRGKSWAASIAARLWRKWKLEEIKAGRGDGEGYFDEVADYFWSEVPTLAGTLRNFDTSEDLVRRCQDVGLLILDDLGSEKGSDFLGERLYAIVNHRYAWERPTIVTTNLDLEQMGAMWPRMASRLCSGTVVGISGVDQRLQASNA